MSTIADAINEMVRCGLASPESLQGCTEDDISQLESHYRLRLPRSYREFLLAAGRRAGKFLRGTDFLFADLLKLREVAEELLMERRECWRLSPTAFVFLSHQGYQFLFFDVGPGLDDPPVLYYLEGEPVKQVANSFTEWLCGGVRDECDIFQSLGGKEL